jgi:hypothetical protein
MAQHALMHRHRHAAEDTDDTTPTEASARDTYGGTNWGACFFGWLVAVGVIVLLAAIASAVAAGIGHQLDWSRSDAENNAGSIGLGAAIALVVIVMIGYDAGGYVAGRMSRFDGARQGFGVWLIGLLALILAGAAAAVFGTRYDITSRMDLPSVDISSDQLGWGAAITGAVVLVAMLIAALAGAAAGGRYHRRIDRATYVER